MVEVEEATSQESQEGDAAQSSPSPDGVDSNEELAATSSSNNAMIVPEGWQELMGKDLLFKVRVKQTK